MSILIKGMEMPKEGHILSLVMRSDGKVLGANSGKALGKAIPVPPHGDLIDLKAQFKAQYYDEMTEEWSERMVTVEDVLYGCMVDEMPPTIIEAEEGET